MDDPETWKKAKIKALTEDMDLKDAIIALLRGWVEGKVKISDGHVTG